MDDQECPSPQKGKYWSLSAWLTGLIKRELLPSSDAPSKPADFLEALTLKDAPGWFYERDLPLESRQTGKVPF